jgi:PadR family transcriptional regulator PadR
MPKKPELPNEREGVVLASLIAKERYGLNIRDEYESRTRCSMPLGSLYVMLDRMEEKGLVKSRYGESTSERGGNRRRYFRATVVGVRAVYALREAIQTYHD